MHRSRRLSGTYGFVTAGLLWTDEIGVVASEVFDVLALLSSLESLARRKPDVAVFHDC